MSSSQQQPPSASSTSTGTGATNVLKRRREDHTAQSLRMDWQIHVSKIIQLASYCKADTSTEPAKINIEKRAEEVVNNHKELKKLIGKMESVVRGKEEEVKGLILDRGSSGCVGRRRKKNRNLNTSAAP